MVPISARIFESGVEVCDSKQRLKLGVGLGAGEVPHLDGDLGEVQPNIFEGNLCENEECEDCNQIREADEKSDDLEEDEGQEEEPEKDRWQYAAEALPDQPPLEVPLWYDDM